MSPFSLWLLKDWLAYASLGVPNNLFAEVKSLDYSQ